MQAAFFQAPSNLDGSAKFIAVTAEQSLYPYGLLNTHPRTALTNDLHGPALMLRLGPQEERHYS